MGTLLLFIKYERYVLNEFYIIKNRNKLEGTDQEKAIFFTNKDLVREPKHLLFLGGCFIRMYPPNMTVKPSASLNITQSLSGCNNDFHYVATSAPGELLGRSIPLLPLHCQI